MADVTWIPHRFCVDNDLWWIRLNVIGNLSIALSYYAIPLGLLALIRKRAIGVIIGQNLFRLFACFIFLCGTTHVLDVLVLWKPYYWLQTAVILLTAGVSIITAIKLIAKAQIIVTRDGGKQRFIAHTVIEDSTVPQLEELLRNKGVDIGGV